MPKSGIFANDYWVRGWGESSKAILQVSIAVFSGAVEIFFGQRWLSPTRKKLARTPMPKEISAVSTSACCYISVKQ